MKNLFLKIFFSLFIVNYSLLIAPAQSATDGLHAFRMADTFADIYEKLDGVKWGGKGIGVAMTGLEKMDKSAHIATSGKRIVLVWRDTIVGNWPKPGDRDWKEYGQITTAMILKMREYSVPLQQMSEDGLYEVAVSALLRGIDEGGRYIHSNDNADDGRLLTSAGVEGSKDRRGNIRVTGVFKGGPADVAGIREGDLISEINGRATRDMAGVDIAAAFSGLSAGTLKLNVLSPAGQRIAVLRRASVIAPDADIIWKVKEIKQNTDDDAGNLPSGVSANGGILEIIVYKVSDNAAAIINEALGKHDASAIAIDLRSAGGDDERAAAKIAGLFMGQVPVLRAQETLKEEVEVIPGGDAIVADDVPIAILVSGGTTGTAEALAAAFYEYGRAALIGTPTAGRARLATTLELKNGGQLEVMNRILKTSAGRKLDGRGVFPIVCLSNIKSTAQQDAFFINVINGDFGGRDFNTEEDIDPSTLRHGCPPFKSGADEDAIAGAVSAKILTDDRVYEGLIIGTGH